jgi:SPP1 gp7 family putative phage head morphogenesis protein
MPATGTGTGRDATPPRPPTSDVDQLAHIIAADVAHLENDTIDAVMPALREARAELRRDLGEWLARADGAATFTAQDLRRGLLSIETALETIGQMRADLQTELAAASGASAELAASHLRQELARFANRFSGSIRPTQISTAAIIARAKHEIIPRIRTSSARYVQAVREDMRHQLAVGLAKGETFTQMTNRLRRLGGPRGLVALRGVKGDPGAHVEEIAEGLFTRYRHWAERVVRTEVMNAYAVEHVAGIAELNEDLKEDGDDPLLLKWDASPDKRICATCRGLDGRVTKVGKPFAPGITQPPAHPNCRCVAVAWHPSWGDIDGEFKPISAAKGVKLPSPAKVSADKPTRPRKSKDAKVTDAIAKGDFGLGRAELERQLERSGFAPQPATKRRSGAVVVKKLPPGILGSHQSLSGNITITPKVAKDASEFADAFRADPKGVRETLKRVADERRQLGAKLRPPHPLEQKAMGMHVITHETLHGYGPQFASQYVGIGVPIEEVTTEVVARKLMRERYGVVAQPEVGLGAYETYIQQTITAVRSSLGVSPRRAASILERASVQFRKIPQPASLTAAAATEEYLGTEIAIAAGRPAEEQNVIKALRSELRRVVKRR